MSKCQNVKRRAKNGKQTGREKRKKQNGAKNRLSHSRHYYSAKGKLQRGEMCDGH